MLFVFPLIFALNSIVSVIYIDGNYTTIGFYDYGSDNLTWVGTEKWTGMYTCA